MIHYVAYHRPRFYRYLVATPGFRVQLNRYGRSYRPPIHGVATIGVVLVVGRWAYCVKWATAKVRWTSDA
jgi:hypothetical protein